MPDAKDPTRILVADDEVNIRRLITDVLEKYGNYEVDGVANGEEAVFLLAKRNYLCDLLLTDLSMPEIGGEALLDKVLALRPNLGVVVITAYNNDENVINCLKKGAIDYISKPIEVEKFLVSVGDAVRISKKHHRDPDAQIEVDTPLVGWMEITSPNDIEYVERFNRFLIRLHSLPFREREREELRAAINEVGKRAMARESRNGEGKTLRMSYAVFSEQLIIMIEDEGSSFGTGEENDRSIPDQLATMRRLMDEVMFSETGHIILLTKKFGSG